MFFRAGKTNKVSLTHVENWKIQSVFRIYGCFHVQLRVICFKKKHFSRIYVRFLRNYKFVEGKRLTYVHNLSCQISSNLYSVETNKVYPKSVSARYARYARCKNNLSSKSVMPDFWYSIYVIPEGLFTTETIKKCKLFHTNVHKTLTNVWEKTVMPDIQ